jgi:hypothetical protein
MVRVRHLLIVIIFLGLHGLVDGSGRLRYRDNRSGRL